MSPLGEGVQGRQWVWGLPPSGILQWPTATSGPAQGSMNLVSTGSPQPHGLARLSASLPILGPATSLLPCSVSFQGKFLHEPGWWSGREVVRHGGAGRPKALLMAILNGTGSRDRTACAVHSWRGVHSKGSWAGRGQLGGQWGPPTPILL